MFPVVFRGQKSKIYPYPAQILMLPLTLPKKGVKNDFVEINGISFPAHLKYFREIKII